MSDENTPGAPKELREALDRANENLATQTSRADAAETNLRVLQATTTFKEAKLNPKHADLFLKTNPEAEATAESVAAFAEEYGLTVAQEAAAPAEEPATPPANAGLAGLGGAAGSEAGGSTPAAQPKMSSEDFSKLLETNPQEAAQAYVEGRAPRNSDNVQADYLVKKGIIDH